MTVDECIAAVRLTAATRRKDARRQADVLIAAVSHAVADMLDNIADGLERMHAGNDGDKTPTRRTDPNLLKGRGGGGA